MSSNELYVGFRQLGDIEADNIISKHIADFKYEKMHEIISYLTEFKNWNIKSTDDNINGFIFSKKTLKFDKKNTLKAANFYQKHQTAIGLMLACYSLPYCYLAENGAQVLAMSGRMVNDAKNRLKETGQFLKTVMRYDNWDEGTAQMTIAKVRLLHALWRYKASHSTKWNAEWGLAINQEDMAGTNLSFSIIVIRGLRKMGVHITEAEEQAYMLHWHFIGQQLGILDSINPKTIKEAIPIDNYIAEHQFKSSDIGKTLSKSLLDAFEELTRNKLATAYFTTQTRTLLGKKYADYLSIPETKVPSVLVKSINFTSAIISNLYD